MATLLGRVLPTAVRAYGIERLLADGGEMSYADYLAHHQALGHGVLFRHERWLSPELRPSEDSAVTRTIEYALEGLRRARRLQAELQHPRVLPVMDFFQEDGEWFSVFGHSAEAQSLHTTIEAIKANRRPPFSIAEFVAVSAGVTDGLAAVHRAGFVHRTLATDNVLVGSGGHVLLADLGCATPIDADDDAAKAFRLFMRPASAAPEQFAVEGTFSPAVDNWALGIALFELRYARHPFWTKAPATIERVRMLVATAELSFPPVTDDNAEHLLQPWLRRLLERQPEKRYSDALE